MIEQDEIATRDAAPSSCSLAVLAADALTSAMLDYLRDVRSCYAAVLVSTGGKFLCFEEKISWVAPTLAGGGQLAALHAALIVAPTDPVIAIGGRQPWPREVLLALAQEPSPCQATVLQGAGGFAPLPGRYRRACLCTMARALREGCLDLQQVVESLKPKKIPWPVTPLKNP